ncbi:MAG: rhamnulokinase [Firmicutes bacterium]|nr:rhamnulokinase [Bacillota bacterium]
MYYLAIDIGASSGRHILGEIVDGKLKLEEVHRFSNGMVSKACLHTHFVQSDFPGDKNQPVRKSYQLVWDTKALFEEILTGLAKCKAIGKIPQSVGIDTWGVDFVLLNKSGSPLGNAVAYRDSRTDGMDKVLNQFISEEDLYAKTGIQKMPFNTIYQLLALKQQNPELLAEATGFLLMPEYFSYLLTGVDKHEYTNATTTGMINAHTGDWDFDLIERAGLPKNIFGKIVPPGTKLGGLLPHIKERVGFGCNVILPCTHDTASAVVAAPIDEGCIYLSSGTWSLMGTELHAPICTEAGRKANLTNEGGFGNTYRYLKNIMGLWIIQSIKSELDDKYSFEELCEEAEKSSGFPSRIDVNNHRFMAPASMIDAIKAACAETGQEVPENIGELTFCVYQSLADSYAGTVQELENITGKSFDKICIVGGGSQNVYLNQLTANACKRTVTAGPTEGTAAGNILVQMIAAGQLQSIDEARQLVKNSFDITEYIGG